MFAELAQLGRSHQVNVLLIVNKRRMPHLFVIGIVEGPGGSFGEIDGHFKVYGVARRGIPTSFCPEVASVTPKQTLTQQFPTVSQFFNSFHRLPLPSEPATALMRSTPNHLKTLK